MKIFAAFVALVCFAAVSFANDGTVSVLKTANEAATTPAATQPTVATTTTTACCEEARVVKLSPWTVRRLNRVADRQEAREARNCCCKGCNCSDDCNPKTLVVESRKKTCNCNCR